MYGILSKGFDSIIRCLDVLFSGMFNILPN